jgi:hypothetical protein
MAILGTSSVGGTNSSLTQNFQWASGPYTATENGTITEIAWYVASTATSFKLGVFLDNAGTPGALIAVTGITTSGTGWRSGAASGQILAGQSYWIGMICNNSHSSVYSAGTKGIRYVATNFATGLTDPYPAGSTLVANQNYSGYATYTPTPTLTITTPLQWKLHQRDTNNVANIPISGTSLGNSGSLEARFNNGAWSTIATISGDGSWNGTLTNQSSGRGTLEVRMVSAPSILASVNNIGIGDLYLVCGDSLSEGQLTNAQNHNLSTNKPSAYKQNDTWAEANDPVDNSTNIGSHWPLLANLLTTYSGIPIAFVTTGTGSTDIAGNGGSLTYYAKPNAGYTIVTQQSAEVGNNFAGMLLHFGPNAASSSPNLTKEQYLTALETFSDNIKADIQANLPIYLSIMGRSSTTTAGNEAIRMATAEAIARGKFRAGPNYITENWSDGVHPKTDSEAVIAAAKWFAALNEVVPPKIEVVETTATGVRIIVDADLDTDISTYNNVLFSVNGTNPTSAIREGDRSINLIFAVPPTAGNTIKIAPAETAITAGTSSTPSSTKLSLPVTLQSISTISQPIAPTTTTIVSGGIISRDILATREGVLRFPSEAAAILQNNPPNLSPPFTNEVLATRAGVLRFPKEAALLIQN